MSNLRGIIEQAVKDAGVLPFARFMELALYCPNFGYYEQLEKSPGRRGDFFTSVGTGPLFGELLARQFVAWLKTMPPGPKQIVEAGAHDGRLAADILRWLKDEQSKVFGTLEYWILEPSTRRRQSQADLLRGLPVRWFDGWNNIPRTGVQ